MDPAGQRRARGLEYTIDPPHEMKEDSGLNGLGISGGYGQLLSSLRQHIAVHLVKEHPGADDGQDDVNQVADIEQE